MHNRPTRTELLIHSLTEAGASFWINGFLIAGAVIISIFFYIVYCDTKKETENEERKAQGKNKFKKNLKEFMLGWIALFLILNALIFFVFLKDNATSSEGASFFGAYGNTTWYEENFSEINSQNVPREYKIVKVEQVSRVTGDKHEEKIKSNILKPEETFWTSWYLDEKQEIVYRNLQKQDKDAEVFFVRLVLKSGDNKIKNTEAFVTIEIDSSTASNKAVLSSTADTEGDPGDAVQYGNIVLKKNIFR